MKMLTAVYQGHYVRFYRRLYLKEVHYVTVV